MQGNLYVRFVIKFPETLDPEASASLAKVLPASIGPTDAELSHAEECHTRTCNIESELKQRAEEQRRSGAAYNSDSDDEGAGGHGVQCAQQ